MQKGVNNVSVINININTHPTAANGAAKDPQQDVRLPYPRNARSSSSRPPKVTPPHPEGLPDKATQYKKSQISDESDNDVTPP